jgi:DNA mismatch repair protein MutS2
MGFNEATLQPTYELRLGMPGKSAGLDIATRLKMPQTVLSHARAVLPRMQADFQDLLTELHRQVEDNARRAKEMEEAREQLANREAAVETDAVRREQQRQREWERKSESMIADFEARAQVAMDRLAEVGEQRKASEQAQRVIAKTKREFREEAAGAMSSPLIAAKVPERLPIEEGARVRLKDVREVATVRRLLKNGMLEVEAGFLKMQVPREDVAEVVPAAKERRLPKNVRLETGPRWDVSYRELNIIGQRAEEAIEQVDKFLDSAALASVNRVRIVHGHGMGVLKKAVGELLGTNPHVSRFYPAPPAEGGTGATIVELRE